VLEDEEIQSLTSTVLSHKNLIYIKFVKTIEVFNKISIPEITGFRKTKYFYLRSNAFSLFLALLLNYDLLNNIDIDKFNETLKDFCLNLPEEYINAAKNSTMDRKQRQIRHSYLDSMIKECIS